MNVLVVVCHPDPTSFTYAVAARVCETLEGVGQPWTRWDLYGSVGGLGAAEIAAADTLILIYPTWWSGFPAMLVSWFEQWWDELGGPDLPERRVVAITSHGSGKPTNMAEGETGRLILKRRISRHVRWVAMYGIDRADASARDAHLARAARAVESAFAGQRRGNLRRH